MKPTHDSLLLRVSCLRTHQTVLEILSDECVSTKLGVTVNHVLVSLASPFYDLALHLCVLSTILTVLAALLLLLYIYIHRRHVDGRKQKISSFVRPTEVVLFYILLEVG